jgi:AcrR family transcriptional regulator
VTAASKKPPGTPGGGASVWGEGRLIIGEVALAAFAELGYHGVSIRDIAKRSGMSLSALYYHYASKYDLLVALLEKGAR